MLKYSVSKHAKLVRAFSSHVKVAIIGGGTAGVGVSAQLAASPNFTATDITVFEPLSDHNYQPSYTMIGGGVLSTDPSAIIKKAKTYFKRPMHEVFTQGVNFKQESVLSLDPDSNMITTNKGDYTYDFLVVTPGWRLRFDKIKGAQEAMDDYDHPVVSIYREDYAYKTLRHRERMYEGKAIFHQPPMPIKCGGAPQKIMYLSESRWRQLGRRNQIDVLYYTALPVMFPPCEKFSIALDKLREEKGIPVYYKHILKAIDKQHRIATFEDKAAGKDVEVEYDFMHIVPPHSSFEFIEKSKIAGAGGFVGVDHNTMQNQTYKNVFSWGDAASLPASKTAASAFSQIPVLVHNLNQAYLGNEANAKYDGYGSCPLFVGDNKLMLAEFKYGGVPAETFFKDQEKPRRSFFYMKKEVFPRVYFNIVPKGKWYGHDVFKKPHFSF